MSISIYRNCHPFGFRLFKTGAPAYLLKLDQSDDSQNDFIESIFNYGNIIAQEILLITNNGSRFLSNKELEEIAKKYTNIKPIVSDKLASSISVNIGKMPIEQLKILASYDRDRIHVIELPVLGNDGVETLGFINSATVNVGGMRKLKIASLDNQLYSILSKLSYHHIAFLRYNDQMYIALFPRNQMKTKMARPEESQQTYISKHGSNIRINGYSQGLVTRDIIVPCPDWCIDQINQSNQIYQEVYKPILSAKQNPYAVPLTETAALFNVRFFITNWAFSELSLYISPKKSTYIVGSDYFATHEEMQKQHPNITPEHELYCIISDAIRLHFNTDESIGAIEPEEYVRITSKEKEPMDRAELTWG